MSYDRSKYNREYYKLHRKQILEQSKDYFQKNKEKILARKRLYTVAHKREKVAYDKIYRETHEQQRKVVAEVYKKFNGQKMKRYDRNKTISFHGKRVSGVNKRLYNGYCELCGRVVGEEIKKLSYHHWDDEDIKNKKEIKGIWVCWECHQICELVEKDKLHLIQRYLRFKRALNKKQKIEEELKPQLN